MKKILIGAIFTGLILITATTIICANSPAPPSVIWFEFNAKNIQDINIEGIQLIGCESEECSAPILLQQYGFCDSSECLQSQQLYTEWPSSFECAGLQCRAASARYVYDNKNTYLKIIVQFPERTLSSQVFRGFEYGEWGEEKVLQLKTTDMDLVITEIGERKESGLPDQFLIAFILTQMSELIMAYIYTRTRLKLDPKSSMKKLIAIFLINLATFPVVWFYFPTFAHFTSISARTFGRGVLVTAVIYAGFLVSVYRVKTKRQKLKRIIGGVVILPIVMFIFFIFSFASAYGYSDVPAAGVSFVITIIMAEIFAFVAETSLLVLSRRYDLRYALELSLSMNTASLILGLFLFNQWQF